MASTFREFSSTYDRFIKQFPEHPLAEEIRRALSRNRLPKDDWLKATTQKMEDMMTPFWLAS